MHKTNPDGKISTEWDINVCPYCGTEPIVCTKCNYYVLNRTPGILDSCIMNTCNPQKHSLPSGSTSF